MAKKSMLIELSDSDRSHVITLPINPAEVTVAQTQLNQAVQLLNGEANLLGEQGLDKVTIESFFPDPLSPLYKYADHTPETCHKIITDWQRGKLPIRLIIAGLSFNKAVTIDTYSVTRKEGCRDLYYSLGITEYKQLNVPSVKVDTTVKASIKRRPAPSSPSSGGSSGGGSGGQSYTVKNGDTLWGIATKFYGDGTQYTKIYNASKDIIESTAKSRGFGSSDNGHWIWAGEVLTIP